MLKKIVSSMILICIILTSLGLTAYGFNVEEVAQQIITIIVGEEIQLPTTCSGNVEWHVDNFRVLEVDTNTGLAKGLSVGKANVLVMCNYHQRVETIVVYVTEVPVNLEPKIKKVSSGSYHTLALTEGGDLWAWGSNRFGQIGNGESGEGLYQAYPVLVKSNVKYISAGGDHSLALTNDGTVWAWGNNAYGQIGNGEGGTGQYVPNPHKVQGLESSSVNSVVAGRSTSFAITTFTAPYAWGRNTFYQLGTGEGTSNQTTPAQVMISEPVKYLVSDVSHTAAITTSGALYTWGYGYNGQLGNGDESISIHTQPVEIKQNMEYVAIGQLHTVALDKNGNLWAWGNNYYGQLGNGESGSINNYYTPTLIPIAYNIKSISARGIHTAALTEDGTALVWGGNDSGQIGDGTIDTVAPHPVEVMSNIIYIETGLANTFFIGADNNLWGVGYNEFYQVANCISHFITSPLRIFLKSEQQCPNYL